LNLMSDGKHANREIGVPAAAPGCDESLAIIPMYPIRKIDSRKFAEPDAGP
jgi:hypothetical protein